MEGNLVRRILLEAQRAKQLIRVCTDPMDLDRYAVGFVHAVRDEDFTLDEIDREGRPDGLSVRRVDDVLWMDRDSRYLHQVALLRENQEALVCEEPDEEEIGVPPTDCLTAVLERAQAAEMIVRLSVDTGDDSISFYGRIVRLTEEFVQIDCLSPDGEPDGETILPLEYIGLASIDGRDERRVALLHRHRTHLYL